MKKLKDPKTLSALLTLLLIVIGFINIKIILYIVASAIVASGVYFLWLLLTALIKFLTKAKTK